MDVTTRSVKLTAKERHALAELAKPVGKRDYSRVHGHTIHALQRKGLFGSNGKPGGALTPAGHAELVVPNIFDDLFDQIDAAYAVIQKEAPMPKTKQESDDAFRSIEHIETTLHDTVRERFAEGADQGGVRLYRTANPLTHGKENGRWSLQVRARVKTKTGLGKHFAIGTASMSREDLQWLRDQINAELRRKS